MNRRFRIGLFVVAVFVLGSILVSNHYLSNKSKPKNSGSSSSDYGVNIPIDTTVLLFHDDKIYFNVYDATNKAQKVYCLRNGELQETPIATRSAIMYGSLIIYLQEGIIESYNVDTGEIKNIRNLKQDYGESVTELGTNLFGADDNGAYLRIYDYTAIDNETSIGISIIQVGWDGNQVHVLKKFDAMSNCYQCILDNGIIYYTTDNEKNEAADGLFSFDISSLTEKRISAVNAVGGSINSPNIFVWNDRILFLGAYRSANGDWITHLFSVKKDGIDEREYPISTKNYTMLNDTVYYLVDKGAYPAMALFAFNLTNESISDVPNSSGFDFSTLRVFQSKVLSFVFINNAEFPTIRLYDPNTHITTDILTR